MMMMMVIMIRWWWWWWWGWCQWWRCPPVLVLCRICWEDSPPSYKPTGRLQFLRPSLQIRWWSDEDNDHNSRTPALKWLFRLVWFGLVWFGLMQKKKWPGFRNYPTYQICCCCIIIYNICTYISYILYIFQLNPLFANQAVATEWEGFRAKSRLVATTSLRTNSLSPLSRWPFFPPKISPQLRLFS